MIALTSVPNTEAATTERPYGALKDDTSSGSGDGTPVRADWLNDMIQSMYSILEYAGITPDDSVENVTGGQFKEALLKSRKEDRHDIGELFFLDTYKDPAAWDADNPDDYFPAKCLDAIDRYEDIAADNWPLWISTLRTKKLAFLEGRSGEVSSFSVSSWEISSNIATLTFEDDDANNALFEALAEDQLVHGSYPNWRPVTLASAIGDIPAGDYAIADIDAAGLTISFDFTADDNSGSGTYSVVFYPHRIADSTTTARLFEVSDRALISPGDDAISSLRQRDQLENHTHGYQKRTTCYTGDNGSYVDFASQTSDVQTGGAEDARVGDKTRNKNLAAHVYIWGKRYEA